jgi:hypothetical protein
MTDPDPVAVLLKFGFLAVLYLFLLWIAFSARRDLRSSQELVAAGARPTRGGTDDHMSLEPDGDGDGAALPPDMRPRLEVVAAKGREPGHAFDVRGGARLGRSDACEVPIDDSFASSAHARVFARDGTVYIEDLGSTNGTFLNGRQISGPEPLSLDDTVRIGDTELRYQV